MFIPTQTPDLQLPLTQLLEAKPVVPVSAVPGIPEDAQHLHSRVALQWAQPVLPSENGQTVRASLAVPLAVQTVKSLNIQGFEPQGPDPDALQKGDVHPLLSNGLAAWINSVASKTPPVFQARRTAQKTEPSVMPALLNLYEELANSEIFSAQRLSETWLPRRLQPQLDAQNGFVNLAQPKTDPSISQLTHWVMALEPDSEPAQQAAQMLTQGQMVWLAELAPGMPMRMVREDAWRNNANRPTQLEKGAMLQVELNLPNLGRIRVVGSQWGQDISLQIAHDGNAQGQWTALAPSLLSDLQAQGIDDVRVETLPPPDEVQNG